MIYCKNAWVLGFPVNSVHEPAHKIKVLVENTLVVLWVLVVILLVKCIALLVSHKVSRRE